MADRRRAWIAAGILVVLGALVAGWLLTSDDPLAAIGLGPSRTSHDGPDVLGGGAGAMLDAGLDEHAAGGPLDGGWGSAPPLGVWLPTATVAEDPASPDGSLSGRVISSHDGVAIAGAELVFIHEGTSTSVSTGADGTFSLRVSEPGRYVLSVASAEGYLPFAPEWGHSSVAFEAAPERRVEGAEIHLTPLLAQVVEVVHDEAPVEGAAIRLMGADSGERTMAPIEGTFTTDAEGRATVRGWAGATVEATHPEHGVGRARLGWRPQADPIRIGLAEAPENATGSESIAGVVVDMRGAPIEGAVVQAWFRGRGLHPRGQAATGPDGRFTIEGLDRGNHYLVATHPARPRAQTPSVATGTTDARIQMQGGVAVTGRVVDESGQPVPAFTVIARVARGALVRHNVDSVSSYDPGGRFVLAGLAEGAYELVATSRGFPPSEPVPVTVGPHGAPPVTLTLARGGRIEGVVTSAGEPLAGATIALEGRLGEGSAAVPLLATAVSGPDGHYVLEGVGETLSSVRVSADGHHHRILGGLLLRPGATQTVDVDLTPLEDGEEPRTELAGIGVVLMPRGEALMVGRVVEGGGAAAAGLSRGDLVLAVDGHPVTELGFGGTIDRIRGVEGSRVILRIQRHGEDAPTDIAITRQRVRT